MNAGRELDFLVAEKVMGLVPQVDFGIWTSHEWENEEAWDNERHSGARCRRCFDVVCVGCDPVEMQTQCLVAPPAYSTNIAAAWQVVGRFPDASVFKSDYYRRYEHAGWLASMQDENGPNNYNQGFARAATAPLAICLAALKAAGVEVPE